MFFQFVWCLFSLSLSVKVPVNKEMIEKKTQWNLSLCFDNPKSFLLHRQSQAFGSYDSSLPTFLTIVFIFFSSFGNEKHVAFEYQLILKNNSPLHTFTPFSVSTSMEPDMKMMSFFNKNWFGSRGYYTLSWSLNQRGVSKVDEMCQHVCPCKSYFCLPFVAEFSWSNLSWHKTLIVCLVCTDSLRVSRLVPWHFKKVRVHQNLTLLSRNIFSKFCVRF